VQHVDVDRAAAVRVEVVVEDALAAGAEAGDPERPGVQGAGRVGAGDWAAWPYRRAFGGLQTSSKSNSNPSRAAASRLRLMAAAVR